MPIKPETNSLNESPFFSSFNRGNASGKRNIEAAVTRNAPTTSAGKYLRPCFMRIKEVPQMRESTINKKIAVKFLF